MSEQHLHNKLGNVIGEEKREMFDRLKAGIAVEVAVSQFVFYVAHALADVVENLNPESVTDSK